MSKVLFVDDERDLVTCARIFFEEAGYEFIGVFDGMQAIEKARRERPDLVCLDVTMPLMSGWDVLEILQEDPQTAEIPVLMLTGQSAGQDKARGWNLGCTWYHTKPFDFDELLIVVKRILDVTAG